LHHAFSNVICTATDSGAGPPESLRALMQASGVMREKISDSIRLEQDLRSSKVKSSMLQPLSMQMRTALAATPWAVRKGIPLRTRYSATSVALAWPPVQEAAIRSVFQRAVAIILVKTSTQELTVS